MKAHKNFFFNKPILLLLGMLNLVGCSTLSETMDPSAATPDGQTPAMVSLKRVHRNAIGSTWYLIEGEGLKGGDLVELYDQEDVLIGTGKLKRYVDGSTAANSNQDALDSPRVFKVKLNSAKLPAGTYKVKVKHGLYSPAVPLDVKFSKTKVIKAVVKPTVTPLVEKDMEPCTGTFTAHAKTLYLAGGDALYLFDRYLMTPGIEKALRNDLEIRFYQTGEDGHLILQKKSLDAMVIGFLENHDDLIFKLRELLKGQTAELVPKVFETAKVEGADVCNCAQ